MSPAAAPLFAVSNDLVDLNGNREWVTCIDRILFKSWYTFDRRCVLIRSLPLFRIKEYALIRNIPYKKYALKRNIP